MKFILLVFIMVWFGFLFLLLLLFFVLFFSGCVSRVALIVVKIAVLLISHFADWAITSTRDPSFFLGLSGNDTAADSALQAIQYHT